jgi:hypothetical protein
LNLKFTGVVGDSDAKNWNVSGITQTYEFDIIFATNANKHPTCALREKSGGSVYAISFTQLCDPNPGTHVESKY